MMFGAERGFLDVVKRVMSLNVNRSMVRSLARTHSVAELEVKLDAAVGEMEEAMSADVVVTGANMKESGTTGEYREGRLDLKIRTYEAAISLRKRLDAGGTTGGANRRMNHVNFRHRVWGF